MRVELPVEWNKRGNATRVRSTVEDLSEEGLFLRTALPLERGSELELEIRTALGTFWASGIVKWTRAGLGMGLTIQPLAT